MPREITPTTLWQRIMVGLCRQQREKTKPPLTQKALGEQWGLDENRIHRLIKGDHYVTDPNELFAMEDGLGFARGFLYDLWTDTHVDGLEYRAWQRLRSVNVNPQTFQREEGPSPIEGYMKILNPDPSGPRTLRGIIGDLLKESKSSALFRVRDNNLAPLFLENDWVFCTADLNPRPGNYIVCQDKNGEHKLWQYKEFSAKSDAIELIADISVPTERYDTREDFITAYPTIHVIFGYYRRLITDWLEFLPNDQVLEIPD